MAGESIHEIQTDCALDLACGMLAAWAAWRKRREKGIHQPPTGGVKKHDTRDPKHPNDAPRRGMGAGDCGPRPDRHLFLYFWWNQAIRASAVPRACGDHGPITHPVPARQCALRRD